MISELIDKQDNFEIVRDQIGAILTLETASQMIKAAAASKDPDDWKLRIFLERSNPWEEYLNTPVTDKSPLVNIWYSGTSFKQSASNVMGRQAGAGTFNIDCYGYGASEDDGASGHKPGDREAAFEVQKALRLTRNILMAAEYTYLALPRGLVWRRWPRAINVFQPQIDNRAAENIVGARIAFEVDFNELSPQIEAETLEFLSVQVTRSAYGELLINSNAGNLYTSGDGTSTTGQRGDDITSVDADFDYST